MPSGPWPSALFPSKELCLGFYKTGTFPLFPSLPSLDLPGFAPPVCFPPERAEDSFLISKPHPAWRPPTRGCLLSLPLLCLLPSSTSFSPCFSTLLPSHPSVSLLLSPPSLLCQHHSGKTSLHVFPLHHPLYNWPPAPTTFLDALAKVTSSALVATSKWTLQPISCLACQSLTLLAKPCFVERFPFSNS